MQNTTYKQDDGVKFGTWNDHTSKIMYDNMSVFIPDNDYKTVADYGGANGLLSRWFVSSKYITD